VAQRIRFDNESESVNVFGSSKDSRGDRPRLWRIFGGGPLRFCAGYAIIYAFLGIEYPRRWGYRRGNRRYAACGPLEPSCCEDGGRSAAFDESWLARTASLGMRWIVDADLAQAWPIPECPRRGRVAALSWNTLPGGQAPWHELQESRKPATAPYTTISCRAQTTGSFCSTGGG